MNSPTRALYRRDRENDIRESRFKANGQATPQERQQLRAELDGLAAEVERMMANRDVVTQPGHANTPGIDNRQFNISERALTRVCARAASRNAKRAD